jgi:hypothetical protein
MQSAPCRNDERRVSSVWEASRSDDERRTALFPRREWILTNTLICMNIQHTHLAPSVASGPTGAWVRPVSTSPMSLKLTRRVADHKRNVGPLIRNIVPFISAQTRFTYNRYHVPGSRKPGIMSPEARKPGSRKRCPVSFNKSSRLVIIIMRVLRRCRLMSPDCCQRVPHPCCGCTRGISADFAGSRGQNSDAAMAAALAVAGSELRGRLPGAQGG